MPRRQPARAALAAALVCSTVVPVARALPALDECVALQSVAVPGATLTTATRVAATADLPGHCRVQGVIPQAIRFEVRLPLEQWNGRFYLAGCGGFCGQLKSDEPAVYNAMNHGLRRGYAAATTDAGHAGANVTDGRWALDNLPAEIDWGWRAVAETTRVARDLIRAFYGRPAQRSYFFGCSTGGRMGLMAAQRFPQDFDGIIAGAPALDYTGLVATQAAWVVQANSAADGSAVLDRSKVSLVATAVLDACDARDGERDGLIADPRACDWTPDRLACNGPARADCLTPREVATIEHWYRPAVDGSGRVQYPGGVPRGSEPFWPLWLSGLPGATQPPLVELFASGFLRYMAFVPDRGAAFSVRDYDFDRDPPRLATMARIYDATDPDLTAFRARGGKLLVYHGWADPLVTPQRTLDYYADVTGAMGGAEATREFARLFMLPGFDHCGVQPGPGAKSVAFDPLPALEAWVEEGIAPDSLDLRWQMTDGSVRSRRLQPE